MNDDQSRNQQVLEVLAIPGVIMLVVALTSVAGGLLVGLFWFAPAWIACVVALNKDRGRWWGFWLGWLGVIIAAAVGPGRSHELNELEWRAMQLQIRELEQRTRARALSD